MSFYGKIINYVTNAFAKVNGVDTMQGNDIVFEGDDNIEPTVVGNSSSIVVQYKHKEKAPDSEVERSSNTLGFEQPAIDNYGHLNGSTTFIPVLSFLDDGNGNITINGGG